MDHTKHFWVVGLPEEVEGSHRSRFFETNCIGLETKQAVSKLKELTACKLLNLVQIGDPDLSFHKITNGGNWLLQDTAGL